MREPRLNRTELAHLLGVAKTTLDEYIQAGLPGAKTEAGRWEFEAGTAVRWYRDYLEKTSSIAAESPATGSREGF